MVLGFILKISAVGAALAGVILFLTRSSQVGIGQAGSEVGEALQSIGAGGSSIGKGIQDTLTGIGKGGARLFDPLFTLKTLIYGTGNQGTVSVNPQTMAQTGNFIDNETGQAGARAARSLPPDPIGIDGLGPATISAQQKLSDAFGITTFNLTGGISTKPSL